MNNQYSTSVASFSSILSKYKKWIIGAAVAALLALFVVVAGAGYLVYKTASVAVDKAKTWNTTQVSSQNNPAVSNAAAAVSSAVVGATEAVAGLPDAVSQSPVAATGFVEEFMVGLASHWLNEGLASQEFASMRSGLACFDAIGGPSPAVMLDYAKSQTTDQAVLNKLKNLSATLTPATTSGPASCAQWILSG